MAVHFSMLLRWRRNSKLANVGCGGLWREVTFQHPLELADVQGGFSQTSSNSRKSFWNDERQKVEERFGND